MLERAIAGRTVLRYVRGMYAPWTKSSNLYHAIIACGYTPDDIGKSIDIAVGGLRTPGQNYTLTVGSPTP